MDKEKKKWIDEASYEELLGHWRRAPSGDSFFQGELGDYYVLVMAKKRALVGTAEHVRISKDIGWGK